MATSDLDRQIETLRRCELITEEEVKQLCSKAREILVEESNTQRVDSPVTVCRSHVALGAGIYDYCNLGAHSCCRYAVTSMASSTTSGSSSKCVGAIPLRTPAPFPVRAVTPVCFSPVSVLLYALTRPFFGPLCAEGRRLPRY
jgi:hypothetical protein